MGKISLLNSTLYYLFGACLVPCESCLSTLLWTNVARWPKIQQNNKKISLGRGILVTVRLPILSKRGRKGAGKYFFTSVFLFFFRGSLDTNSFFVL